MEGIQERSHAVLEKLFSLEDQVAVVVGGAGRIGTALSHALAGAGAKVCVLELCEEDGEQLAGELTSSTGRKALGVGADITSGDSLAEAVERVATYLGTPSILVNSAQFRGQGFYSSAAEDYPREAWDQVLGVNLTGVQLACQAFGRAMIAGGGGCIINLASTYGVVSPDPAIYGSSGVNSPVAYGASKAGVIQLTRYLAVHWSRHNVRVNCLVPGGVFDNQSQEFVDRYCERTPLGRMAAPEDYQGPVLFMASPSASYMTGAVLTVDGGWTAW